MHPKKAKKLLAAGHLTQDEYNEIVAAYQAKKAEEEELQKLLRPGHGH